MEPPGAEKLGGFVMSAVDVFEVGVEQVKEFAAQNFYPGGLGGCFDLLDEGVYLVVECCAHFGYVSTPWVHYCFQSEQKAIDYVVHQDFVQNSPKFMIEHDAGIGYEVWHVVDDADLWLMWEFDVAKYKMASGQALWRVYECDMPVVGGTPVMELAVLPHTIYHLICRDATNNLVNWVVSDSWYSDGHEFCKSGDISCAAEQPAP